MRHWLLIAGLTSITATAGALVPGTAAVAAGHAAVGVSVSPINEFNSSCPGQNTEIEQAADPAGRYVYEEWMGCNDSIGVATSSDGGLHFGAPVVLSGSTAAWDPSIVVAPNGTVYAAFMNSASKHTFPVVEASFNHGATFPQVTDLVTAKTKNWGDRDFIAVAPTGEVYVTWDYGPSAAKVKFICPPSGSCSFSAGDLNEVVQKSTNGGKTFGPMVDVSPGFPNSGADSGPLFVEPGGRIDMEYQGYQVINKKTDKLGTANSYFTSSTDGGASWSKPVRLGPKNVTMDTSEWWIDGAIAMDAGGDLYATWDTQSGGHDVGWLTYSTDHGATWSALQQVTTDVDQAAHIVEPAGGPAGTAYVGWLADNSPLGYAQYLRVFSIARGWLTDPIRISTQYGATKAWPGDTFGITALPGQPAGPTTLALSWGSAVGTQAHPPSEDFAAVVTVTGLSH